MNNLFKLLFHIRFIAVSTAKLPSDCHTALPYHVELFSVLFLTILFAEAQLSEHINKMRNFPQIKQEKRPSAKYFE